MMLLGLRGVGKTVLLNEIGRNAEQEGLLVSRVEAPEGESLARLIFPEMRKVMRSLSGVAAAKQIAMRGLNGLRNFASVFKIEIAGVDVAVAPEPGLADTGDLQYDLPDLFTLIGKAVAKPMIEEGASIAAPALQSIVDRTQGYPFFLQEWASVLWDNAEGPEVTLADVDHSYPETIARLDEGFFKVRFDRLTRVEVQFVKAMAHLGDGPYAMADIARSMGRSQQSLGPARASILSKGMIYSADHGYLDFSVPLFADFMRRQPSP